MPNTLFRQSEIHDPYSFYEAMINDSPVYRDEANGIWAVYSYEDCKTILLNESAHIPAINPANRDGLNEYALLISNQLVRLSNGPEHELARAVATQLSRNLQTVSYDHLPEFLKQQVGKGEIDWISAVCKRLPLLVVLGSFAVNGRDADFIAGRIESLVKLMLPSKTAEQVAVINDVSKEIYAVVEEWVLAPGIQRQSIKALASMYDADENQILSLCVSNFIGLLIQSYDAGRGILSNSMLQILTNMHLLPKNVNREFLRRSVIETLRFNPPIQNTRRVAIDNIVCKNGVIPKGETILVVLASANRDPQKFELPAVYDIDRNNNHDHLTFGLGRHACLANHFSVEMATETLLYYFTHHKDIRLLETCVAYERLSNARLPKRMMISLS